MLLQMLTLAAVIGSLAWLAWDREQGLQASESSWHVEHHHVRLTTSRPYDQDEEL